MARLHSIRVEGFKSIRRMEELELRRLNVLIGVNGAGKSNLLTLFQMVNRMSTGHLQEFIGMQGGADWLLHNGGKITSRITCVLQMESEIPPTDLPSPLFTYSMELVQAQPDTLVFSDERTLATASPMQQTLHERIYGSGHKESRLSEEEDLAAANLHGLLGNFSVFHFHDTSETSHIRKGGYIEENRALREDAGNLAAFLYRLRQRKTEYYRRIVAMIQQVAPFFRDFELAPSSLNPNYILLNWRERESDFLFGPHQLSDGTLRTMALVTLLLQPDEELPDVLIVDEPELGLHPSAIQLVASLMKSVSTRRQVNVATQSVSFVDRFAPEDVVVVERGDAGSAFKRKDSENLKDWVAEYSLGQLWEKNVIGGRP